MNTTHPVSRRLILQASAATAVLGAPGLLLAQPKPVKVGLLHPVSGALAYSGGQSRLGGTMAIDEINAAGHADNITNFANGPLKEAAAKLANP